MFTIYIDRLHDGREVEIDVISPPQFLDIENDPEIQPESDVVVSGRAYLAGNWLVIDASISTSLLISCSMCNEQFSYPIHIERWVHEEPIENIKSGLFAFGDLIREAILLEVPFFARCGGEMCKRRDEIKKYLRPEEPKKAPSKKRGGAVDTGEEKSNENGYQPFKDLTLDDIE